VSDFGDADLFADPAAVVLDEDLKHPAARGEAALDGERRAAGNGLVRS
jgi:hypothetical protein